MRKSSLFISAVLTAFVMAMLTGVASAYQNIISTGGLSAVQPKSQTVTENEVKAATATIPTAAENQTINWTPEEAAGLAAQVLGRDDLYSVEVADLNGETVFLVTFSSGDLVYVSLDGQIRSIGKVQVETVVVNSGGGGGGGRNDPPSTPAQNHENNDDNHEDREDHEEHIEHTEHEDDD